MTKSRAARFLTLTLTLAVTAALVTNLGSRRGASPAPATGARLAQGDGAMVLLPLAVHGELPTEDPRMPTFTAMPAASTTSVTTATAMATEAVMATATEAATASSEVTATEALPPPARATPDPARLPIGDGKLSSAPEVGKVWSCTTEFGGGGAFKDGPWIRGDGSFDFTAKAVVDGAVEWPHQLTIALSGAVRSVTGNDLPRHATGTYPVSPQDDAYQYDRNPNRIAAQTVTWSLPAVPVEAATASCVGLGPVGVMLTGAYVFNGLDALGRDAVAHEIQDSCQGHPERNGSYHYHSLSLCAEDPGEGHSAVVGYALDGFGIFGRRGEDGRELASADLEACHGHSHEIDWDGQRRVMFHYHATLDYPYTVGCYRGTPIRAGGGGGRPPRP